MFVFLPFTSITVRLSSFILFLQFAMEDTRSIIDTMLCKLSEHGDLSKEDDWSKEDDSSPPS